MRVLVGVALAGILASVTAHADCTGRVGRDLPQRSIGGTGLSAQRLVAINKEIDAATLDVRALLVVHDCQLVFERYRSNLGRDNIQTLYSATKSFTATLAGVLMQRGALPSLDVPLSSLIAKPSNTSAEDWHKAEQITLRNVMGMTSGLDTKHSPFGDTLYLLATDRVFESLKPPVYAAPGTVFRYSDRSAALYGAAIESVAKTGLYNLAREALFGPLEFGRSEWLYRDREGRYPGGWGLRLRPMDMAKLGQLYLQRGTLSGQSFISSSYVDTVWTPGPNPAYGLGWWIGTDAEFQAVPLRYANGAKGQRIFVYPRHNTVVVVLSSLAGAEERQMFNIVAKGMAAAFGAPATPDPDGERQLGELAKSGFRGTTRVPQEDQDTPGR